MTNFKERSILHDIIINNFMYNPDLHDKSEDGYCYTVEKIKKLKELSLFLKEININITVTEIVDEWKSLVAQFKKCYIDDIHAASGSSSKINDFIYYEDMKFLVSLNKHRLPLSTMQSQSVVENNINLPSSSKSSCDTSFSETLPSGILRSGKRPVDENTNLPSSSKSSCGTSFSRTPPSGILHSGKKPIVPEYDDYAKKKMKMRNDDDHLEEVNQKIILTLDAINKKLETNEENASQLNYTNILAQALSKILSGKEDECLQYVLQKLEHWK